MRTFARWLAGLVGIAALARLLSRRSRSADVAAGPPAEPDPAEELRRKLDEVRANPPAAVTGPAAEPAAGPAADANETAETTSIEDRRAAIHARAQEAIDAMREVDP